METDRRRALFLTKTRPLANGCWEWVGRIDRHGYGKAKLNGQILGAHRVAFMLLVGELEQGQPLDHRCHDASCELARDCPHRRCVNPEHLRPTTIQENTQRGRVGRSRIAQGDRCRAGLHAWEPSNIIQFSNGRRGCKACDRAKGQRWRASRASR